MRGTSLTLIPALALAATWAAWPVASATQVYKWVDENGVTHYSDQPHENAAKVDIREPQTYPAGRGPPQPASQAEPAQPPAEGEAGYASCSITEPAPDQVYLNTFSLTVTVSSVPALRSGDRIVLMLDGHPQPGSEGPSFTIAQIDRGTHSVEAMIQDAGGATLCRTRSTTFHVRQPTVRALHPR